MITDAPPEFAAPHPDSARAVAIVGGGPRGVSVLERLLVHAASAPLTIDLYDRDEPGSGRVWNPRQSPHLLMNTPSGEVTIFSGPPDGGPARAGAGPSLAEWSTATGRPEYAGYETRRQYGHYLHFAVRAMLDNAHANTRVRLITDTVLEVHSGTDNFTVRTPDGSTDYDAVVLATGHPGDSAADLPLDRIGADATVAAIGMGLGFHDVVALLTQARGGRFAESATGELEYIASGAEPRIVGLSRSGLPILARGRNEKSPSFSFTPRLCTVARMRDLRKSGQLDFYRDVHPWVMAEVAATYCRTRIAARSASAAASFLDEVGLLTDGLDPHAAVLDLGRAHGVDTDLPALESMARPFTGRRFASGLEWSTAVSDLLRADLREAQQGNVSNPVKAALDTLRDLRPSIRAAVNAGGLTPVSHERDFLGRFAPVYSMLAAGPPARRNLELLALLRAGVLRIAGPGARLTDDGSKVVSPAVPGSIPVDTVIDTRITQFRLDAGTNHLDRQLLADGLVRRYRHAGATGAVDTGACETSLDTGEAIGRDGSPVAGLFVIGIPTERHRWFTQIGNGRPGVTSEFSADADRIARNCLQRMSATRELVR